MKDYSSKPGKKRLEQYTAPLHLLRGRLNVHLSKELRKQLGRRSATLRTGDIVQVLTGTLKGKKGKVTSVNTDGRALIEKIVRKKANGTEIQIPIALSNLVLLELNKKDKRRFKSKPVKGE